MAVVEADDAAAEADAGGFAGIDEGEIGGVGVADGDELDGAVAELELALPAAGLGGRGPAPSQRWPTSTAGSA
ncbi:MAG: hypothetical protein ACLFUJ_13475 [Phycisphaerae bacterium]